MKKYLSLFLRGIPIGISLTLPGVSGGTMALILGIYDRLIHAIKKVNLFVLVPILLGGIIGVLLGSRFITYLLFRFENQTVAFLLGLVLFSVKVTFKEAEHYNYKGFIALVVGIIVAMVLWNFSKDDVARGAVTNLQLFLAGFVSSGAMILPGISGATLLIMLGLYGRVLEAVQDFNMVVLIIYGLGAIIGLFTFSWILSYLLDYYRTITMMTLTGLIIGSARAVIPQNIGLIEFIAFVLGGSVIIILSNEDIREYIRRLAH